MLFSVSIVSFIGTNSSCITINTNKTEYESAKYGRRNKMATFIKDCETAIKELESVLRVLHNQEKINAAIDEMKLDDRQKEILVNLFYGELK